MSWNDDIDNWKDSYDDWKLRSPDDEYDEPCDHENFEVDIITGRCHCDRCPESWYASDDEIDCQIRLEAEYYEHMERENRRQWWRDLWSKVRSFFWRPKPKINDDDLPF